MLKGIFKAKNKKVQALTTSNSWIVGDTNYEDLSPTAQTCTDFIQQLAYSADFSDLSLSELVADVVIHLQNYGYALLVNTDKGYKVADPKGSMLKYNELGEPVTGKFKGASGNFIDISFILPGLSREGILVKYKDLIKAESTYYNKVSHYFKNMGVLGIVARARGNQSSFDKLAQTLHQMSFGENTGKAICVSADDVESVDMLQVNITDVYNEETVIGLRNLICATYGFSPDLLYTDNSNRSTAETASDNVFRFAIYPRVYRACQQLTAIGIPISVAELKEQEVEVVDDKTNNEETLI